MNSKIIAGIKSRPDKAFYEKEIWRLALYLRTQLNNYKFYFSALIAIIKKQP